MPKGIPHSKFLSWPEEDQDKAIEWTLYQSKKCPNCGSAPEEWVDENGRWVYPDPYKVIAIACTGCKEIEEEKKKAETSGDDMTGVYMSLVPNYE